MKVERFIGVGENIHCTRIYKVGGKYCVEREGDYVIRFRGAGGEAELPVPRTMRESADWEAGRVKHCAAALWQANYGEGAAREAGVKYIESLAAEQERQGAGYLDINVDEFSTDVEERARLMAWTVEVVQQAASIPVSVDSSNTDILKAGLQAADQARGRPMVNSVSLERTDAIEAAAAHGAVVIASAAGESGLPETTEERMANLARLVPMLESAGLQRAHLHIDPLVFPISTDSQNGVRFLEAVSEVRGTYGPEVHIVAGLSNVSFGMPNRKLINQVYACLAVQAGADGGIVDPAQVNADVLNAMDTESESFKLARALLTGEDAFGMEYIRACREGRI